MAAPLIVLGRSPRAAAQSARRAGYEPWCLATHVTRDLAAIATVHTCPPDRYPAAMLPLLQSAPAGAPVLLAGDMENHPDTVNAISFERKLLGPTVDAIRRVRDPLALPTLPRTEGLRYCKTRTRASLTQRLARLVFGVWGGTKYLIKPRQSYQGHGIEWWTPGRLIGRHHYVQQYVRGTPYAAVFFADGWSARLLGVAEQLVGEAAFGATGFRVCGHLGPIQFAEPARAALSQLGVQLTQRFDLRGLFGVDLIMDYRGKFWPIEINPRYVDAIDVLERATGAALLAATGPAPPPAIARVHGQATLFARHDLPAPPPLDALPADQLADLPTADEPIPAGGPIVTLFATAASRDACERELRTLADQFTAATPGPP